MVPREGLEPSLPKKTDFKSVAAANYAIQALVTPALFSRVLGMNYMKLVQ